MTRKEAAEYIQTFGNTSSPSSILANSPSPSIFANSLSSPLGDDEEEYPPQFLLQCGDSTITFTDQSLRRMKDLTSWYDDNCVLLQLKYE